MPYLSGITPVEVRHRERIYDMEFKTLEIERKQARNIFPCLF
jgi:hypothetical protein